MAARRLALAALLVGCSPQLLAATRDPEPAEHLAIARTVDAYEAARGPVDCEPLERAVIGVYPHDELQERCLRRYLERVTGVASPASACTYQVQRHAFEAPRTAIYVDADLDAAGRAEAIRHEAAHAIRGCHLRDVDRAHSDAELWGPILDAARTRRSP